MSLSTSTWHALDFEGSRHGGVVEHGLVTVTGGAITAVQTRVCRPHGRIRAEETAVHGLAEAATAGAEPFAAEWDALVAARRSGPLAAHSAGFENSLLKAEWPHPPFVPDFARPGHENTSWGPWLDTRSLHRKLYPGLTGLGLEQLVETFGLKEDLEREARVWCPEGRRHYHCAGYDALGCALLLLRLARLPELADASLADWLAWSGPETPGSGQGELFGG